MEKIIDEIVQITKKHPNLMPRSKKEILKCHENNQLIIKHEDKKVVGFVIRKNIFKGIKEIGAMYVAKEHRGKKYGKELFLKALDKSKGEIIIARTKHIGVKSFLKKHGFTPVSMKRNIFIAFVYLQDRIKNWNKFKTFIKSINKNSCLFVYKPN